MSEIVEVLVVQLVESRGSVAVGLLVHHSGVANAVWVWVTVTVTDPWLSAGHPRCSMKPLEFSGAVSVCAKH